jgi:hypothetical protein
MSFVTGLNLTNERRAELRALLSDEQRLDVEYPKIAEYLDASSRLSGTGDAQADSAFDLRIVHYMTGGKSVSRNPYWDIVAPSISDRGGRRVVDGGSATGSARLAFAEMFLQAAYAYAIPSPETIDWISNFVTDQPVVEMGAGRGYWADQMSHKGITVDAYEIEPPHKTTNASFPHAEGQSSVWYPVKELEAAGADMWSDHVLFLCWPPGWGDTMASDTLEKFEMSGGSRLIYIGEQKGGKTGNDAFFESLSSRWKLESVDQGFVSWWDLTDTAQGWIRA